MRHPGTILREDVLPALDISPAEFAVRMGVSPQSVTDLLLEKCALSPEMALHIAAFLKTSPESWLNMQADMDRWSAT
ncbi:HigA family addiction module antitoxin [Duganella callida]|uniref:Addiction module antidote protein, HigA family n=1 Tax=Duganella callida TaxID=2561932 RepID=A0A4Y9SJ02_9BURK|nr:HigA family addiction module antitoxin [Duganella callida]TFW25764.1 addiction module antidote protein, HigA family [Duganella callida]